MPQHSVKIRRRPAGQLTVLTSDDILHSVLKFHQEDERPRRVNSQLGQPISKIEAVRLLTLHRPIYR